MLHSQSMASRITCSILFVAESTTRDLVTWPRHPRKAAKRRVNSHVITTKHVAVTRFGYRVTNIWPYNEIAISRLIVACWHIPRLAGGRSRKPEGVRPLTRGRGTVAGYLRLAACRRLIIHVDVAVCCSFNVHVNYAPKI